MPTPRFVTGRPASRLDLRYLWGADEDVLRALSPLHAVRDRARPATAADGLHEMKALVFNTKGATRALVLQRFAEQGEPQQWAGFLADLLRQAWG